MRQRKSLFWTLYAHFLVVTLGALGVMGWTSARSLNRFHQEQVAANLLARARILASELPLLPASDPAAVDRLCKDIGRLTLTRLTVTHPDGRVIGDSDGTPLAMENHRDRPEIAAALAGGTGKSIRYSDTVRRRLLYLAVPYRTADGAVAGVVRVSLPLAALNESLAAFYRHAALSGLGVAAVFAALALVLSRHVTRPLAHLRQAADQFAHGDLGARVPIPDTEELGLLARTMNQMAAQLSERIRSMALQHNEQRAVLANMTEGVLAVDLEQRILQANPAACRFFGLDPETSRGRHLLEVARHIALQEFIGLTLAAEGVVERDAVLRDDADRHVQLRGVALKDETGAVIGGLVVMSDVTRLKRLESLRRDLVANVSHELKTPLTSLKGCVETLSDGGATSPEDNRRFLDMMGRQILRLEAMVDDLLALSRLEHEAERGTIELAPGSVTDVLARGVQAFHDRAAKRGILLVLDCPGVLTAPINAGLLEQAVGNLVDNALKYSGEETTITVSAALQGDHVLVRVADQGIGIEAVHLERIFERFYRVDPARSRAQGGTGLGLAIVKHIALAHRGSVAVESVPGKGSTFTIRLPAA
jgi:two-component system phosphate regulon sensor histidine kinase PhoR